MNENKIENLNEEISKLEAIELELIGIDADELDQNEKNKLAEQLSEIKINLTKLQNADLKKLSEAFKAKEPNLRAAAGKLEEDLKQLTTSIDIINTVAAGMKTITDIIKLIG